MTTQEKLYSFDVFDTCVSRRVAHPKDVFQLLGARIAPAVTTDLNTHEFARLFQVLRIDAERRAYRAARPHESADIYEIYQRLTLPCASSYTPADLINLELEIERDVLFTIPETLEEIERIRRSGHRIIFISDMYIPAKLMAPILKDLRIMNSDDSLYVSCDVRLAKHTGNLFRHIIAEENIRPAQLIHTGDNLQADVRAPELLGISTRHFTKAMLNSHEKMIARQNPSSSLSASTLAGLSRRSRLTTSTPSLSNGHSFDTLIHGVIAPFLISFVAWVLTQAKSNGIKRLYFVARDGQITYEIAKRITQPEFDLDLKYLYGSRRTWVPASITADSDIWSRALAPQGQNNSIQNILRRAGLSVDQQENIIHLLHINSTDMSRNLDAAGCKKFIESIRHNEDVLQILTSNATRARKLTLRYLEQEGLFDQTPWALVDTGWALNCQAALKRMLSLHSGADVSPMGYYIALANDRLTTSQAGKVYSFVRRPELIFCRRRTFVEHCITPALHASTVGYAQEGGVVKPILGEDVRGESEMAYVRDLHGACIKQAELVGENPQILQELLMEPNLATEMVENFILNPSKEDAKAMQSYNANADFFHEATLIQPFCRPFQFRDLVQILRMTFSQKARLEQLPDVWLEGSCVLSPLYIRAPLLMLLRFRLFLLKLRTN